MNREVAVETIETHTAGEPTRIVHSGLESVLEPGQSVHDQREAFAASADELRELLLCEPRGHDDMFGAVLVDPHHPSADVGVFFMDTEGYLDMCGHATIGVVTALIETGRLEYRPTINVETPVGLIEARPVMDGAAVERVAFTNADSWYCFSDEVVVDSLSQAVSVDVASAGNTVGLVDVAELPLELDRGNVDAFVSLGLELLEALENRMEAGPEPPVSLIEFYERRDPVDRNMVVFGKGAVDRSPCGTGTCAKMTVLYETGALGIGEEYPYESIIGTQFTGKILDVDSQAGTDVVTPELSGSAHIIGKHQLIRNPGDSLTGFRIDGR